MPDIVAHLKQICEQEEVAADEASLMLLARKGDGALRDALSAFDPAVSLCGADLHYADLADALRVVDIDLFFEATEHVAAHSSPGMLRLVDHIVRSGYDLQEFLVGLSEHLRNLLVARTMDDMTLIEAAQATRQRYAEASRTLTETDLLRLLMIVDEAEESIKSSTHPRMKMEMALLKMASLAHAADLRQALQQLDHLEAMAREGKLMPGLFAPAEAPPVTPPPKTDAARAAETAPPPDPAPEEPATAPPPAEPEPIEAAQALFEEAIVEPPPPTPEDEPPEAAPESSEEAEPAEPELFAEAARAGLAYARAREICDEDVATNQAIGGHGLGLIRAAWEAAERARPVNLLTHCNAGWLATVDWGTALAPIYLAHDQGIPVHVWVDETRPRNQGAGLTAWELGEHGVAHTVIVDSAGGHLMQRGRVDLCITGTDRTTAAGDVCNKIGTYLKALAARDNGVPFYVALPGPTIDWTIEDGLAEIPIEERAGAEVAEVTGMTAEGHITSVRITPANSPLGNYAFDVTPARLITGLITERGVCPASREGLLGLYPERHNQ